MSIMVTGMTNYQPTNDRIPGANNVTLTLEDLKSIHAVKPALPCPTPGCTAFPFETQADLDEHIASGRHPLAKGFAQVPNGFDGTTTVQESPRFSRPARSTNDPATEAQASFIRSLLAKHEGNPAAEVVRARLNQWRQGGGLTKAGASKAIEDLKALPVAVQAPAQPQTFTPRPNRYAQDCDDCGKRVEAGEGVLTKADDGSWIVEHKAGECPITSFPFPFGRYAVEIDDVVKFYVVSDGGLFAQASDDLYPVRSAETVAQVVALISADPLEASKRYGREFEVCGRCGRGLTSEWRKAGIGPVCAGKAWS